MMWIIKFIFCFLFQVPQHRCRLLCMGRGEEVKVGPGLQGHLIPCTSLYRHPNIPCLDRSHICGHSQVVAFSLQLCLGRSMCPDFLLSDQGHPGAPTCLPESLLCFQGFAHSAPFKALPHSVLESYYPQPPQHPRMLIYISHPDWLESVLSFDTMVGGGPRLAPPPPVGFFCQASQVSSAWGVVIDMTLFSQEV